MANIEIVEIFLGVYYICLFWKFGIGKNTQLEQILMSVINLVILRYMIMETLPCITFSYNVNPIIDIFQFVLFYLIQEFYMYGIHILMHKIKFIYRNIHSVHHEAKGECWSTAMYMHPIEIAIHIYPDLMLGPLLYSKIFEVSNVAFIAWTIAATFWFVWSHSGQNISYMPSVKHHWLHHKYYNCNYGSWITDTLFGTNRLY